MAIAIAVAAIAAIAIAVGGVMENGRMLVQVHVLSVVKRWSG